MSQEVTVSLGPNGELRYPSFPPATNSDEFTGVGEFQCYNKYTLSQLKEAAESAGNPLWGLAGPHDAPKYNESPTSSNFFKDHGGSWETPYGNFFLSWYSQQLLNHGDRLLSIASNVFGDLPVRMSAKVPLLHQWHDMRSRPAELTAGFYNASGRDGYDAVAEMFAKYDFMMVIPAMDKVGSNPELLLNQIKQACRRHNIQVCGENSALVKKGADNLEKIKQNAQAGLKAFMYQRMGAEFFSPEHWPLFRDFVRSMGRRQLVADDLPDGNRAGLPLSAGLEAGNDREMQTA
jgi:Glycosyl hydrolase family 14